MLSKLLASDEAFEWGVRVPFDPARYDSRTIMRLVKQVNRRGSVRWFQQWEDGEEERWYPSRHNIVGEDDLATFVRDMIDTPPQARRYRPYPEPATYVSGSLVVSFDDKSDARALARDLAALAVRPDADRSDMPPSPRLDMLERSRTYPPFKGADPDNITVEFMDAQSVDPAAIDTWFRERIKKRYRVALWSEGDGRLDVVALQLRYWRLSARQWQRVFGDPAGRRLLVNFESKKDALMFALEYGGRIRAEKHQL